MAKTLTFSVSSYTVEINQTISGGSSTINLLGSGRPNQQVKLQFSPQNPFEGGGKQIGMAENIDSMGKVATFFIWFEPTAFAGFYQVLSSEKPVSMKMEYEGTIGTNLPQFWIDSASLFTGSETPGDYEKS